MSWNHPEHYSGKGKGKGGGYGNAGGWHQQQPAAWQQPAWQQQAPQQDPSENAETSALAAKLKAKELQLEMVMAKQTPEVMEDEPEIAKLKRRLEEQDADKQRLKKRLEEQEAATREREMEERVNQRVEAKLRQQKYEYEMRFNAATEPRPRQPPASPATGLSTAGFAMRSGAGAWAEMEENERKQREESERKEKENNELRAREERQQQENRELRSRLAQLEAMLPPATPIGAGVFPSPERTERSSAMSDEELLVKRTDELAAWAELEDSEEKKREWQDLCCLHKVKKVGAKWPATPSGRKKWCERIAKAEIELTEAK